MNTPLVLKGHSLADAASATEAFKAAEAATSQRFEKFTYVNNTYYWTVKLALFQGLDEGGWSLPPGYVHDTGVTVGGVNVTPRSSQTTIVQDGIKCLATRVKCTAGLVGQNGEEQTFHHGDAVAEPGKFFVAVSFGIQPANNTLGETVPTVVVQLVDANSKVTQVSLDRVTKKTQKG